MTRYTVVWSTEAENYLARISQSALDFFWIQVGGK